MAKDMKAAAEKVLSGIKAEDVKALAPGKQSSEFRVVVGVMLAGVVNPFVERILGVKIPEDAFIALVGLATGYLASRTYLKKVLK